MPNEASEAVPLAANLEPGTASWASRGGERMTCGKRKPCGPGKPKPKPKPKPKAKPRPAMPEAEGAELPKR